MTRAPSGDSPAPSAHILRRLPSFACCSLRGRAVLACLPAALLPAALLVVSLFSPATAAREDAPLPAPLWREQDFLPPEACKPCHPQHYEEWRGSMHAYAITDPVFYAMNALGQKETGGELGDFCIRCHGPLAAGTGALKPWDTGPDHLGPEVRGGVSCEVCHRGVSLEPGHPHNASLVIRPGAPMLGGLRDPLPNPVHRSEYSDLLRSAEFCGACHNVVNHRGVAIEKPYDEYAQSVYPRRDIGCIDCHMQTYSGRATPDGPIRPKLHRHDFIGVDTAITPFPHRAFQRREVEAFLRTAATLKVEAPAAVEAGGELEILARVKNSGAGHNLPTGPSTERQMWIEVTLASPDGAVVFRSGHLDAGGDLMDHHSRHAPGGDPQLALFTDHFVDEDGKEVHFMWQAARLVEGTIPPLETRTARYQAAVPRSHAGKEYRLLVRLCFRAFPPYQLRHLGIEHLREEFPVFEMARFESGPIRVVESFRRPGLIRVPEDEPSLQAAFESAVEGEEILVGPGRYLLERPLDFAGRALVLRSRDGPEATVIEMAEPIDASRACLALFGAGEGPSAVIDGFTLRGGRGLRLDGAVVGGAVVCLESHPTLQGNIFLDNAAEYAGGAVYLRGSRALLIGNRFERNRAGGEGGGLFAAGDSRAVLEGNDFFANQAALGGGLAMSDGPHLLGNTLRSNRAFQGGGLALRLESTAGAAASSVLHGGTFTSNSARAGGGLFIRGAGDVLIERAIIAGNLGGGLALEGNARVRAVHVTLAENLLGGGAAAAEPGCELELVNSAIWGNQPRALAGKAAFSFTDDAAQAGGSNIAGFPLLDGPASRWERCNGPEEGCVPAIQDSLEPPNPRLYRRYIAGSFLPMPDSPLVDAGDPSLPPDPDGSRADIGARHRGQARRLFVRGDLDGDRRAGWSDLLILLERLAGGRPALPCPDAADIDGDGRVTAADLARLAAHLLVLGPPPAAPYPECGPDPSAESPLGCFETRCD
jgi:hypothetical protein